MYFTSAATSENPGSPSVTSGETLTTNDRSRGTVESSPPVIRQRIDRGTETSLTSPSISEDTSESRGRSAPDERSEKKKEVEEDLEILSPSSDEEREEEEGGNTDDERNEALSQADLSSVGSVGAEAPPPTRSLVLLGESTCRIPMSCKQAAGNLVLAFCGSPANSCRHRGHRAKQVSHPHSRGTVAYYTGVESPRSREVNGRKDLRCYSFQEYNELRSAKNVDFEAVGDGFAEAHEGSEASGDVAGTYDHGNAVRFDLSQQEPPPRDPPVVETVLSGDSDEEPDNMEVLDEESGVRGSTRDVAGTPESKLEGSLGADLHMKVGLDPVVLAHITQSVPTLNHRTRTTVGTGARSFTAPGVSTGQIGGPRARSRNQSKANAPPAKNNGLDTGMSQPTGRRVVGTLPSGNTGRSVTGSRTVLPPASSDSSNSEDEDLCICGLVDMREQGVPRLEGNQEAALRAISEGWTLKRRFSDWPPALRWFNKSMDKYRNQLKSPPDTRAPVNFGSTSNPNSSPRLPDHPSFTNTTAAGTNPTVIEGPRQNVIGSSDGYIGLEKKDPFQRVCIREGGDMYSEIQSRITDGYIWILRLADAESAREWVQGGTGGDSGGIPPVSRSPQGEGSSRTTNVGSPSMFMVTSDPSAGDETKIFGIDVVDQDGLDRTLAPEGLPTGKDMLNLYERMMDVAALPSNSVGLADADDNKEQLQDVMEITALAITQATSTDKTGRGMMFKSRTNNPLMHIKHEGELLELQEKVRRAAEDDYKSQDKQLRAFMYKRGYHTEYIAIYVDSGGLPRMIRRSVELYKALVETVIQALRSYSEGSWKDSYAQAMLQHWANKLASSRKRAVDYRDHVIDVYIILRDAERKRFQDESFHRVMWKRFEKLEANLNNGITPGKAAAAAPGNNPRCGHCRHRMGHETGDCPLHEFKSGHAVSLLSNVVGKSKCTKLIEIFKGLVTHTSTDAAITTAIASARTEVM
jgi:hypothetical protein